MTEKRREFSWDPRYLSEAAAIVWGKSSQVSEQWMPLWRHLADSSQVAERLWDHWVPLRVRSIIAGSVPGGADVARLLVKWLAGIHDIGKATPSFTRQVPKLADRGTRFGLDWVSNANPIPHHTVTGQLITERWLSDRFGFTVRKSRQLAVVVGGHHGVFPDSETLNETEDRPESIGWSGDSTDTPWGRAQYELLDWVTASIGIESRLADWRSMKLTQQAQILLTAIVIMADWIASNEDLFPYEWSGNDVDRVDSAWTAIQMPPRWCATDIPDSIGDLYSSRFGWDEPYPIQVAAVEVGRELTKPSIVFIEAPMGEGKTEAALALAEVMAERQGASGVVIALPTRATSDGMLTRFNDWIVSLPREAGFTFDVGLGHGKKYSNPEYRRLVAAGFACIEAESAPSLAAHRWFLGKKQTLLTQFPVVTIDQLLFAALKAKHLVLRHLGLAGKVIIIDEAHAYDVYMSQYLERVVEWLGSYGCTVIVLSATLPTDRRLSLMESYLKGQGELISSPLATDGSIGYPVIVSPGISGVVRKIEASSRTTDVTVEYLSDDYGHLVPVLSSALSEGGCVLIVRNTVARAQDTAAQLRESLPKNVRVKLVHSRFLTVDRQRNDAYLRDTFGKNRVDKTEPIVIVATQVAEQSLDIDFDLLVTDLAPIDLILQRMGRLHRHERGLNQSRRPGPLRKARCLITGADWKAVPPEPVKGSQHVYGIYPLLRSAAVLNDHLGGHEGTIRLPDDIAPLVRDAYSTSEVGPGDWQEKINAERRSFNAAQAKKKDEASTFRVDEPKNPGRSLVDWLEANIGEQDDDQAGYSQVRDGGDSIEVILLLERDGALYLPDWLEKHNGEEIPTMVSPSDKLAAMMTTCTITLPYWLDIDRTVGSLENAHAYPAWEMHYHLKGQLVLALDADTRSITMANYQFSYDPDDGLTVKDIDRA